jgi:DNA-binding transcriptional ArsR family regulator
MLVNLVEYTSDQKGDKTISMGTDIQELRVTVLKAIASTPRLKILEALYDEDLSVGELTSRIGSDISTVSRHLSVLRNAGILSSSKDGARVLYHLCTPCVLEFFSCIDKVIRASRQ